MKPLEALLNYARLTTGVCTERETNYVNFGELQPVMLVQTLQQERQLFAD